MTTYILQHVPFEEPGSLAGLKAEVIHLYENQAVLPPVEMIDCLIILGGPMSANDSFPWLQQEQQLIQRCLKKQIPMIGICLGAQLIAKCLGATIAQNSQGKEVGFGYVTKELVDYAFLPDTLDVLHWHGETFELPEGAVRLYRSPFCENQAFIYQERVIGLQFHMETTAATLQKIVAADQAYIAGNVLGNTSAAILAKEIPAENQAILNQMVTYITRGEMTGA